MALSHGGCTWQKVFALFHHMNRLDGIHSIVLTAWRTLRLDDLNSICHWPALLAPPIDSLHLFLTDYHVAVVYLTQIEQYSGFNSICHSAIPHAALNSESCIFYSHTWGLIAKCKLGIL
jgi:hypothetical protein